MVDSPPSHARAGPRRSVLAGLLAVGMLAAAVPPARAQGGGGGDALPALAPGNPFQDVPSDHWAYESLKALKARGLLDEIVEGGDPFRGRKVLTRYEFATLLAQILDQAEKAQAAGQDLTAEERIVRDLTREFRTELTLLGVRVDAFQARLEVQERKASALERRRSNIRMEGLYRAKTHFVDEPTPTENYRFDFDERPFKEFDQRGRNGQPRSNHGLQPLEQEVFLRVTGRASPGNRLAEGIEAFAEIQGSLRGVQDDALRYGYSDPNAPDPDESPVVGDHGADSFATEVVDDRKVSLNRAHFIAETDRFDVRVFSNEAATEPGDPSRLLSVSPGRFPGVPARSLVPSIFDLDDDVLTDDQAYVRDPRRYPAVPWRFLAPRAFAAFSGVEAGGEYQKWTYFGSVLSDQEEVFFPGNDGFDLQRTFTPSRTLQTDSYNLRLTYEPFRFQEGSGKTLLFGLTYNETALSYMFEDDRNRVAAGDLQWSRIRERDQLDATLQILHSAGRGANEDLAYRLDARYTRGGFLGLFKGYSYGHDFQALTAQSPWVDTDVHFNFLRTEPGVPGPDTRGERLARFQLRYTFAPEDLTTLDDLTLETLYEAKAFDRDPLNPRVNDHEPGSRFYIRAVADVDSRIHVEAQSEIQKDIPQPDDIGGLRNEEGSLENQFRIDYRPLRKFGVSGELSFIDDFDAIDDQGRHFDLLRQRLEANLQATPAVFLKGTWETIENSDILLLGLPRIPENGRIIHRFIGESALTMTSNFGLKTLFVRQTTTNSGESGQGQVSGGPPPGNGESNRSHIFVGEANWQLSRALELRYVYGWQETSLFQADNIVPGRGGIGDLLDDFTNLNHYVNLRYQPTEVTEVNVTYGDEYESPNDDLDNGPANFHRTPKVFTLSAQTNF